MMKILRVDVPTSGRESFHDVTDVVQQCVTDSGAASGVCYVFCPHTTAGITINENADPDVRRDMLHALDRIVPLHDPAYRHAEGNSAAHVKASIMGSTVSVLVADTRLVLGTWQGIYLCEFDGPRTRNLHVGVLDG